MAGFLGAIRKKRLFVLLLAVLIAACFAGCSKKEKDPVEKVMASREYVYKAEELIRGEENRNISQLYRVGEDLYVSGYSWEDDGSDSAIVFYKLGAQGGIEEEHRIPTGEYVNISGLYMDENADIYCIKNDYHPIEPVSNGEEGEEYEAEEVEYLDEYYLSKMSLSGEEIFSVKLNDLPELQKISEENGYFYVRDLIYDREKGLFVNSYNNLFMFDFEGNFVKAIPGKSEENLLDNANFYPLEDGRCAAVLYGDTSMYLATVDLETASIQEKYDLPGRSYEYSFHPGYGYDFYMSNDYGVFGYNLGDKDKTQLMSFIDSDLDINRIYQMEGIDEKSFIGMYDDPETGYPILAKFTKVPPEEVKERQSITLAMPSTDWNVRRAVIKFNKENEQYKVSILDYNSLYGTDEDYRAGANKLNMDIVSGKVPDIVLLDDMMPADSYINKGLFEDLKPFIERDEDYKLEDFMPNVVEALSTNGKLFVLVPSYAIQTAVAKTADVGEERGWTVKEAQELLASRPEGTQLFEGFTRDTALEYCMTMSGNQFIDWEKGKCSFDSDAFVEMLTFINSFPETIDESVYTEEYWSQYESMWRDGKVIASTTWFGDFGNYNRMEKGTFGEKITMIGFPSSNEDGSIIRPDMQIAMSAKSSCKEGAWEFLRIFLSEEYQRENIYNFPISIKRLNELAKEAMEKPYYLDENGEKEEYDDIMYINGQEIIIPPMTQEEVDAFMEQLYSFTHIYKMDETLINIISEEAAPYFAGQKSAKDVAAVIQSRVQIYVNENM